MFYIFYVCLSRILKHYAMLCYVVVVVLWWYVFTTITPQQFKKLLYCRCGIVMMLLWCYCGTVVVRIELSEVWHLLFIYITLAPSHHVARAFIMIIVYWIRYACSPLFYSVENLVADLVADLRARVARVAGRSKTTRKPLRTSLRPVVSVAILAARFTFIFKSSDILKLSSAFE